LKTPEPTIEPTPLTFFQSLIKKVFAQEAIETPIPSFSETPEPTFSETPTSTPSENPTPNEEIASSPTPSLTPSETISPLETPQETISETPSESSLESFSEIPNVTSTDNLIATSTPSETLTLSPIPNSAPLFEIRYSFDNENWQTLAQISYDDFQKEFEIPLENWDDIANLQVVIESTLNTNLEENLIAFVDGVQLEVEYEAIDQPELTPSEIENLPKVEIDKSKIFKSQKKDFRANEDPEFEIETLIETKISSPSFSLTPTPLFTPSSTLEPTSVSTPTSTLELTPPLPIPSEPPRELTPPLSSESAPEISPQNQEKNPSSATFFKKIFHQDLVQTKPAKINKVVFLAPNGNPVNLSYTIFETEGKATIKVHKSSRYFQPGKYQLQVEFLKDNKIYLATQEFTWGVLAINTNKSIYLPNETVYLQMAALADTGDTICNANLKLEITSPNGARATPVVQTSDQCGPNNVTDVPDYFAYYQIGEPGIYQIKLTNLDNGYEITDSFEVRDSVPFDIERIGPTRIYPLAKYQMTLKIKANQDFSGNIIENIPDSFIITSNFPFQIQNSQIIWQVAFKAGESYELKYQFDAPDISPYFYLLGALQIGDFQEIRQWQIASDLVARMILLWDPADGNIPSGWTCISCNSGDDFYQTFIRGNSSYGATGGTSTHSHTNQSPYTSVSTNGTPVGGSLRTNVFPSLASHTHTVSVTSGLTGSNIPEYRNLKVIRYDNGIPSSLPQNIIAIFDATPPSGWTASYNDGRYIQGENITGTGGSNTHTHTVYVDSVTSQTSGANIKPDKAGSIYLSPGDTHTHNITTNYCQSGSANNEPPYITVILAKKILLVQFLQI